MVGCEICGVLAVRRGLVLGENFELCSPCFEDVGAERVMTAEEMHGAMLLANQQQLVYFQLRQFCREAQMGQWNARPVSREAAAGQQNAYPRQW